MAVVVQAGFVIMVLALEADRVGHADLLGELRTLFGCFAPRFVFGAPGGVAVLVGDFLRGAEVIALVPGEDVDWQRRWFVRPERVFFEVVAALIGRLADEADCFVADRLGHGNESAGLVDVMDRAAECSGVGRGAAFPRQVVAVPAVKGETAAQFLFLSGVFILIPAGAGFRAWAVVGL